MSSGRKWIFFLRKITKWLYRYRGLSRVADLVRMAYIHSPRHFWIDDFDGDLLFDCALNEHISSQIFWRGAYSTGQLVLLRRILKPGMVFLDAGANKGEFTVVAAKFTKGGKVLAFEPMEENCEALKENVSANGFQQVQIIRKALGNAAGEKVIYQAERRVNKELNLGMFTLFPRKGLEQPCGRIEVVPLDELMRDGELMRSGDGPGSEDLGQIDVMKIDIEGGELEMLRGAVETIRRFRPVIFIEINAVTSRAAGYDQGAILQFLKSLGYRCDRIGRKGKTKAIAAKDLKVFQNLVCYPGCWPEKTESGLMEEENMPGDGERPGGKRVAFFIPDLRGGGAERAVLNLLKEMVKQPFGPGLDLVLVHASGVYLKEVPPQVRVVDLRLKRTFYALPALARYLRRNKPSALIAFLSHANTIALLAKKIAGVDIPVVVVEQTVLLERRSFPGKQALLEWGMKKMYPHAAARVACSEDTARNIERRLGFPKGEIKCIYNPVVNEYLEEKARLPVSHPWLEKKEIPVFLGVGRLVPQKDFALLLEAFARVRKERPARLIILGEGRLRKLLQDQAQGLGIERDTDLPGFAENPFAYMARCHAFVLSSRWEGLSNVLIEAMACGCAVISTDCPAGPREVLEDGKFGLLVPVGNAEALANAMLETLGGPAGGAGAVTEMGIDKEARILRAAKFSAERAVDAWLSLLAEINH